MLKGTSVYEGAREERREGGGIRERWEEKVKAIAVGYDEKITFEVFSAAVSAVVTRGFNSPSPTGGSPEGPYLLPLVDLLNHSSLSPSTVLTRTATGFSMTATRAIPAGTEVTHSYGPFDNSSLLKTYGFVTPDPPLCSPVAFPLSSLLAALSSVAERFSRLPSRTSDEETWDPKESWPAKVEWLERMHGGGVEVTMEGGVTDELVTVVAAVMVSGEAFEEIFSGRESEEECLLEKDAIMSEPFLGVLTAATLSLLCTSRLSLLSPTAGKGRSEGREGMAEVVKEEERRVCERVRDECGVVLRRLGEGGEEEEEKKGGGEGGGTKKIKLF